MELERFRHALLDHYDRAKRPMPWRLSRDPYAILVSEVMLQQTQVKTVIPYYLRFLERFPTPNDLAAADEQELLVFWQGLGYYRRARNLQAAAAQIASEYAGVFPRDKAAIDALHGVGPYTSAAVASIAFGLPFACVDGNVVRVISRLDRSDADVSSNREQKRIAERAQELLDQHRPGDFNQAMMELGATVCTPKSPGCLTCPVNAFCQTYAHGEDPQTRPFKSRKQRASVLSFDCLLAFHGDQFLLARRLDSGLMASMWELPAQGSEGARPWSGLIAASLQPFGNLPPVLHRFTHIHATYRVTVARSAIAPCFKHPLTGYAETRLVRLTDLIDLPLTKVMSSLIPQLKPILSGESQCEPEPFALPGMPATR